MSTSLSFIFTAIFIVIIGLTFFLPARIRAVALASIARTAEPEDRQARAARPL